MNGVDLLFTNWSPGEPNDNTGSEDCVEFEINPATGTCDWNDLPCSLTVSGTRIFRPICKQEQTEMVSTEGPHIMRILGLKKMKFELVGL